MSWSQNYAPLGGLGASALVAALPIVLLLGLLAFFHVRAHRAALASLVVALGLAVFVYGMPAGLALRAAGFGAVFGLFPIGWIVLNAIFIYDLSVFTGGFATLRASVAGLSGDRRIQALLIAFSFGAFIEGCAGFGAPVAITGAMMIGLGFKPLEAAKLALIGNTAPVAFGSLGIPLTTLADVTGLDLRELSATVGSQLPFFSLIVPFWLVAAQVGWRGMREVWPACLVCGASFAIPQFLISTFHGPWLVDLVAACVSMLALVVLSKFWQPARTETCPPGEPAGSPDTRNRPGQTVHHLRAWLPWLLLLVFVALWTTPFAKALLNGYPPSAKAVSTWRAPLVPVPQLAGAVLKVPPAVAQPVPEKATYQFNYLSATGTALFFAGGLAGLLLGLRPLALARLYAHSLWRVRVSLLTIALMLALGYTTRFSGLDTTLGLALAGTGWLFPFFAPLIGWLGVALTGSDTASNVLFGNLQKVTAEQLHLSPVLMAASNSSGGVMGKMIDAQSIVVASVATGGRPDSPDAGTILRAVFWHSVALALLMGFFVMFQAYVWPR